MRSLERDTFERQMEGYLPTADVAFVDEIFKANSSILNSLLTVLNERAVDNGSRRLPIPLVCLIGAHSIHETNCPFADAIPRETPGRLTSRPLVAHICILGKRGVERDAR